MTRPGIRRKTYHAQDIPRRHSCRVRGAVQSARAQGVPRTERAFTEHVAAALRRELKDAKVTVEGPLTLKVGSFQANLDRIFAYCRNEPNRCRQEVSTYVKAWPGPTEPAPSRRPGRRSASSCAPGNISSTAPPRGYAPAARSRRRPRDAAGLRPAHDHRAALRRRRRAPPAQAQGGKLVVAAPSTDTILYIGEDSPRVVDAFPALVRDASSRPAHPLSTEILRWKGGGLEAVRRPEMHAAAGEARRQPHGRARAALTASSGSGGPAQDQIPQDRGTPNSCRPESPPREGALQRAGVFDDDGSHSQRRGGEHHSRRRRHEHSHAPDGPVAIPPPRRRSPPRRTTASARHPPCAGCARRRLREDSRGVFHGNFAGRAIGIVGIAGRLRAFPAVGVWMMTASPSASVVASASRRRSMRPSFTAHPVLADLARFAAAEAERRHPAVARPDSAFHGFEKRMAPRMPPPAFRRPRSPDPGRMWKSSSRTGSGARALRGR